MFRPFQLRNPEPGAAGGGAPAGGAPAGGGEPAGGGNALSHEPSWETTVPVKFREGGKPDGKILHDQVFKGYAELEGKLRERGAAPAKAEEYKFDLKDEHLLTPEALSELRNKAHAAGLTQKQFEVMVAEGNGLMDAATKEIVDDLLGTQESCEEALAKKWPDVKERESNRKAAKRAFNAYFGGDKELLKVIGNIPSVLFGLAKLGAELKEDAPPAGAEGATESAESLDAEIQKEMANPAYTNQFHKDHVAQKAKVSQLFEKRYGTKPATGVAGASFG